MFTFTSVALAALFCSQSWAAMDYSLLNSVFGEGSQKAVAAIPRQGNVTQMEPQFFKDMGSKRVKISYGPYMAPSASTNNGMQTFVNRNAQKPCDDCLITYMQASLQYPNGTNANSNTGMWLHHTVFLDTGATDTACPQGVYGLKVAPNRFFASGNERTPVNLCANGTSKTGYFLSNSSKLVSLAELMNETPDPREAVMTVEFEYIPSPVPAEFQQMKSIWLDAAGCHGASEVPVPAGKEDSTFTIQPPEAWQVPSGFKENLIVGLGGHMHDGGMDLQVLKNNESVCDCVATYGATADYVDMMANMQGMDMNMPGMNMSGMANMGNDTIHISNISYCKDTTMIKEGDQLSLRANYNMSAHPGMMDADGSMEPVMGISVLYAAQSNDSKPQPSAIGMGGSTATATLNPEAQAQATMSMGSSSSGMASTTGSMGGSMGSAAAPIGFGSSAATGAIMFAVGLAFLML